MKILPFLILIIIFGSLAVGYLTHGFKQIYPNPQVSPSASVMPLPTEVALQSTVSAQIPANWLVYHSPNGYAIAYPSDIKTDQVSEGERFYKHGPTQSSGTELYDGISLLIRTGDLANLSLEDLVQKKHQQMKEEETTRDISNPVNINYGNHSAIQFKKSSLGDGEFIYLKTPNGKYLELINISVEPNNKDTYQKIVSQMIGSITF